MKKGRSVCFTDLADALVDQGHYADARQAYQDSLEICRDLGDLRCLAVNLGQLGALALLEGNSDEAAERYQAALKLFQQLGEPGTEATVWHQLGRICHEAQEWDKAERYYREAARIKEQHGMISGPNGAANTWNQLAIVSRQAGKPEAAELWHRKAIEANRSANDKLALGKSVNNLANLLQNVAGRLTEARQLAEEALVIKKTLDPRTAEIWTTYGILADIAEREATAASDSHVKAELLNAGKRISTACTRSETQFRGHPV